MPRDSSGVYKLPAGNPVVPDTVIESVWANATMDDIAVALTGSLARSGVAPMLGPLTLSADPIVQARQAASKAYVDQFIAASTGMPVGAVAALAGNVTPLGWLLCDGAAVNRVTYATLFTIIGTLYGPGDGSTTFNLPDLRNKFIRGVGSSTGVLGTAQAAELASHAHAVNDPTHSHNHTHTFGGTTGAESAAHTHNVSDPGHAHTTQAHSHNVPVFTTPNDGSPIGIYARGMAGGATQVATNAASPNTNGAGTGIGLSTETASHTHSISGTTGADATASATGVTVGATGGTETRPENVAMNYYIKAVEDSSATITPVLGITSSDPNMISVDETVPTLPELVIKSNVAFGIPKLDASGKILLAQLPQGASVLLGYFDASSGANPSQANPGTNYSNGESYIVSVGGTILVRNPATSVESNVLVAVGGSLLYLEGQSQPDGWYYSIPVAASSASNISFLPEGSIVATNVQAAIAELDSETQTQVAGLVIDIATKQNAATAVTKDTQTGGAYIPTGTTAERPAAPVYGQQRANSTLNSQEWWNGTAWVPMGGGATGGAGNGFVYENDIHVTEDYTLTDNKNGMSAGPIIVDNGVSVTVPAGSVWTIV